MRKAYDSAALLNKIVEDLGAGDDDEIDVIDTERVSQDPAPTESAPVLEVEKKPEAAAPATSVPVAGDAEPHPWRDDYAELKAKYDFLHGVVNRRQEAPPPVSSPTVAKPLREITDGDEYAARIEEMERTSRTAYQAIKAIELQSARRQIAELKAEYPDLDQFIPADQIELGVDLRIKNGTTGVDWREPLLKAYDYATGGKRHIAKDGRIKELESELQRLKDEVAQKRAERESKESAAAAQVPAGGSVYQDTSDPSVPRVAGKNRGVKSYNAAARAMTEALARHGG